MQLAFFSKRVTYVFLDNAFLDQHLVFCVALMIDGAHCSQLTYNRWCPLLPPIQDGMHCPQKRLWILVLPTAFPTTCSLTSHEMSFTVLPVSDCVSTPFALRPQHGTPGPSLPVICADDAVQDEQHAIFHCTQPHTVSLRRRYESLFSEARAQGVVFLFCTHQSNNKLYFSAWTQMN